MTDVTASSPPVTLAADTSFTPLHGIVTQVAIGAVLLLLVYYIKTQLVRTTKDFVIANRKVITGGTEAEAKRKYHDFLESISYDASMALLSGWSGIDFGEFAPDQPLEYIETNAVRTLVHGFTQADPTRQWTLRDLAKYVGIGGAGPVLVGAPEQIADELERWVAAGVDGFNLAYAITPGSFVDFVDGVIPVLQARHLVQREYQPGTLREKIYGAGQARLLDRHPASKYRSLGHARPSRLDTGLDAVAE